MRESASEPLPSIEDAVASSLERSARARRSRAVALLIVVGAGMVGVVVAIWMFRGIF